MKYLAYTIWGGSLPMNTGKRLRKPMWCSSANARQNVTRMPSRFSAVSWYGDGKAPEAIGHWERALKIEPTFAEAHYNLANAFLRGGRFEEAIMHYEQALKIKPAFAEAHYNLGIALEQVGRVQAAIEHYEQVLLRRPDFVELQKRLDLLRAWLPRKMGAR